MNGHNKSSRGNYPLCWNAVLVLFMSGSIPKAIIPPGQTPGHLTFLKMIDQIPRHMGRFQGQMPHWLGVKSQNFHSLSGIDED